MDTQPEVDIQDYIAMFRRRRSVIFWVTTFCIVTALALAIGIPVKYESKGTIMIERAEISDQIVRTTFDRDIDTNLSIQRVSDSVLTRENLEMLIDRHDLYPDLRESSSSSDARRELRSSIAVIPVTAEDMPIASESTETIAFEVAFYHAIPDTARDVARDLVNLFTERHRAQRTAIAMETIDFLEAEASKLEISISETESALAKFKQENAGALPELMGMNLQVMERTERELESVERDIRLQQQNRNVLQAELSQVDPSITVYTEDGRPVQGSVERLRTLEREYVRVSSLYGPEHPDRIRLQKEIEQLREGGDTGIRRQLLIAEITAKRTERRQLLEQYSTDHPDVVKLDRVIRGLETQLATLPQAVDSIEPTNPEYINLKVRLDAASRELAALVARRDELRQKLDTLESRIMFTPQVEREYSELTRDYELAVDEYNKIKNKLNLAKINLSLETEKMGEEFTVYKTPGRPSKPVQPNRPVIFIGAVAMAITLSFGLAIVFEALDSSVRGRRDIQSVWEAPPIAVIPYVNNNADRVSQFARFGASTVGMAVWGVGLFISLQLLY